MGFDESQRTTSIHVDEKQKQKNVQKISYHFSANIPQFQKIVDVRGKN